MEENNEKIQNESQQTNINTKENDNKWHPFLPICLCAPIFVVFLVLSSEDWEINYNDYFNFIIILFAPLFYFLSTSVAYSLLQKVNNRFLHTLLYLIISAFFFSLCMFCYFCLGTKATWEY